MLHYAVCGDEDSFTLAWLKLDTESVMALTTSRLANICLINWGTSLGIDN